MWDKKAGKEISRILDIIADPPNLRPHPEDFSGSVMVFDGGQAVYHTGITRFEFADGTTAFFGTSREFQLTINFASGETVLIRITQNN